MTMIGALTWALIMYYSTHSYFLKDCQFWIYGQNPNFWSLSSIDIASTQMMKMYYQIHGHTNQCWWIRLNTCIIINMIIILNTNDMEQSFSFNFVRLADSSSSTRGMSQTKFGWKSRNWKVGKILESCFVLVTSRKMHRT
jgi:hypothetical protein